MIGEWSALCGAIGRPELAGDARFATLPGRKANEAALDAEISVWTAWRDHIAAMHLLQAAGMSAAAVMTTKEIAEDPHFQGRGLFQDVAVRNETIRLGQRGWRAANANADISRAPEYSEHTQQVLREIAGLSGDQIEKLAAIGAVVLPPGIGGDGVKERTSVGNQDAVEAMGGLRNVPVWGPAAHRLAGSYGIYELADQNLKVLYVGYAGSRARYGLRGKLIDHFSERETNRRSRAGPLTSDTRSAPAI